ncbi:hypothetical protein [Telluribacter sp.]|jgi:hypothetical protein|uniref:hypothetical protein n=1 Tax=Telluribacter sp. TaxID=1978767 RepID=UPI002E15752F|nr:hypothetical protein [Telluribacter sp.]
MTLIQWHFKNKVRQALLQVLLVAVATTALAQPDASLIQFKKERIPLTSESSFYILDVVDKRPVVGTSIGTIVENTVAKPLSVDSRLERSLYDFWSHATPRRAEDMIPLTITVKDFKVTEKRVAPNKVSGEFAIHLTFGWTRQTVPIDLTQYQAKINYTRPEAAYDHEAMVRKLMTGALKHVDTWFKENEGKNPALARGIRLVFVDKPYRDTQDTIFYRPERKLVWNDFQGVSSRPNSNYAAAVFTSIAYEGGAKMNGKYLDVEIGVKVFMVKSMSWGKSSARNDYTLRHEQLHFDVTRLVGERFKERLKKLDLTIEDHDSQIQYEFLEAFRDMDREQKSYDGQTHHGLNTAVQAVWDQKVAQEITRLYQIP